MFAALKNIRRSPYQTLLIVTVLSFNLFIIAIFAFVSLASQLVLNHFETKPQVIAYLADDAKESSITDLINQLSVTGQIADITHISKEQALEIYKQSVGNDPLLLGTITELGEVTAEILPASLEISVKNPASFNQIVEILKKSDVISTNSQGEKEIDFPQDVVDELANWTRLLRLSGLTLIAVISLVSIITGSLVISSRIASRRLEINTLKLIGAKAGFIIRPYLAESVIYALISSFFGFIFAYIALLYSTPFLVNRLSGIISFPISAIFLFYLWLSLTVLAIIISLLSGLLATLRFIKR